MHDTSGATARIHVRLTEAERDALNRAAVALTVREGRSVNVSDTLRRGLSSLCRDLGIAGADGGAQ